MLCRSGTRTRDHSATVGEGVVFIKSGVFKRRNFSFLNHLQGLEEFVQLSWLTIVSDMCIEEY